MATRDQDENARTLPRNHRTRRTVVAALGALVLVAGGAVLFLERSTRPAEPGPTPATTARSAASAGAPARPALGPYPTFGENAVFRVDISQAPIHADDAAIRARIVKDVAENWGGTAPLNVGDYSAGYAVAGPGTPRRDVAFHDCQRKGGTPPGLYDGPKYFAQVPIPPDAVPAPGSDGHLAVWDPEQDRLWEFWVASRRGDGSWQACWGGRIDQVSRANGQFAVPYGVGASGMATAGYMVTLQEAYDRRIEHALGLVVMTAAPGHSYPANRDDGNSALPGAVKEGTRLRLDPTFDVDASGLTAIGKAVAKAAQRYGFIVVDKGGAVAVMAESGERVRGATGSNPWAPLGERGEAYRALQGFPWDRIQVIEHDWGKPR